MPEFLVHCLVPGTGQGEARCKGSTRLQLAAPTSLRTKVEALRQSNSCCKHMWQLSQLKTLKGRPGLLKQNNALLQSSILCTYEAKAAHAKPALHAKAATSAHTHCATVLHHQKTCPPRSALPIPTRLSNSSDRQQARLHCGHAPPGQPCSAAKDTHTMPSSCTTKSSEW